VDFLSRWFFGVVFDILKFEMVVIEIFVVVVGCMYCVDFVVGVMGGLVGNVWLIVWIGLVLLVFFVVELIILFDVWGFISWYVVFGVVLFLLVLFKIVIMGWCILCYYFGSMLYCCVGLLLVVFCLFGFFVVVGTLVLFGIGIVLVLLGELCSW